MVEQPNPSPTAHVRAVLILLVLVIVAALTARWLAYPEGFGLFGHFRADAVTTAMDRLVPLHADEQTCADCHDDEATAHAKDVHNGVECEACHGLGGHHVDEKNEVPFARPDGHDILVPKKPEDCLVCHRRLAARPASFPQIDPADHFAMLHVADPATACKACHSPHEPLFLDKSINEARLHPVINECVDCHKHDMNPSEELPKSHPILFECNYCHPAIAKDYATRTHSALRCVVCHQFYPVSERAGRIVTHRDPRFCLMCHSDKVPRDTDAIRAIAWPQHRIDVEAKGEQHGEVLSPSKGAVCIDCHSESYHVAPARRDAAAWEPGGKS